MKWEDVLRRFCAENGLGGWIFLAADKTTWMQWQGQFSEWFSRVGAELAGA